MAEEQHPDAQERGLTTHVGPVNIDWPRTLGYYGGIGLAVGVGVIDPPLALFVAAVPFFKMLNRPKAFRPVRFLSQLLEGASTPVGGGDPPGTIWLSTPGVPRPRPDSTLYTEARHVADRFKARKPGARAATVDAAS